MRRGLEQRRLRGKWLQVGLKWLLRLGSHLVDPGLTLLKLLQRSSSFVHCVAHAVRPACPG